MTLGLQGEGGDIRTHLSFPGSSKGRVFLVLIDGLDGVNPGSLDGVQPTDLAVDALDGVSMGQNHEITVRGETNVDSRLGGDPGASGADDRERDIPKGSGSVEAVVRHPGIDQQLIRAGVCEQQRDSDGLTLEIAVPIRRQGQLDGLFTGSRRWCHGPVAAGEQH